MSPNIVSEQPRSAAALDAPPAPLRLTPIDSRRPAPRRRDGMSGRRGPDRPGGRHAHPRPAVPSRRVRRRRDRRGVVASILAVLALVGCVVTIVVLATRSTASRLEGEIASLTTRLHAESVTLGRLQAAVARTSAGGADVRHAVSRLGGGVAGLERTVHGLQMRGNVTQELMFGLRNCVVQLQSDFAGLTLRTSSDHGRVTRVGLADTALAPSSCATAQPVSTP